MRLKRHLRTCQIENFRIPFHFLLLSGYEKLSFEHDLFLHDILQKNLCHI